MNSIQQFQLKANKYRDDISFCVNSSITYDMKNLPEGDYPDGFYTNICVLDATTQEAMKMFDPKDLAVLNFSCKRNPAGQSKTSVSGQEADLSKISFLPTILGSDKIVVEYYLPNRETDSYGSDVVLYTPKVPFFLGTDSPVYVDVVSCSAPSTKYLHRVSRDRLRTLLERRIDLIFSSALCNNKRSIILGAWGCGGHGLQAECVAKAFQDVLETGYHGVFENVIFAVPDAFGDNHFEVFDSYFGGNSVEEG